jgi:hypothetical protein
MPALIDSAPDCVVSEEVDGTDEASVTANGEDSLDFVVGNNYFSEETPCSGFMTFGPGSTYGDEGQGAEGAYMALTWIGIVAMVGALALWTFLENLRLKRYVAGEFDPGIKEKT